MGPQNQYPEHQNIGFYSRYYLEVTELITELIMELIVPELDMGLVVTELVIGLVKTLGALLIIELGRDETRLEAELVFFAQADTAAHIAATTAI
jgi:hypothetical protein